MRRFRFPRLAYNFMTFTGAVIAGVTAVIMIFALIQSARTHNENPYVGILVYMVLPPVLLVGLVLIPMGMLRMKRRMETRGLKTPEWPVFDLRRNTHRNAFIVFVAGTVVFVLIGVVGGYQAYHFTESVEFCGKTCHEVMKPEHTAYLSSPHARVPCTSCHVGPGANFYAKSKLSGAYQVYATARNIYPRPIPTPIENLRPAAEVCEQCHWPEKFFGAQLKEFPHYRYDDENTEWPITLLIKTGGGDPQLGTAEGIHWHMNISVRVEYIARDERRQDIPWIRVTDRTTGEVTIYEDQDDPLSEEEIAAAEPRTMDCVDCHNRPSHNYHAPDYLVDRAISSGQIRQDLPEIKRTAVEALDGDYETESEALDAIAAYIRDFYSEDYEKLGEERAPDVERAIVAAQEAYSRNMFPEMKVKWDEYPDNIGHFIYPGCMRCHGGNHASEDGHVISRDCTSCHTILAQGSGEDLVMAETLDGLEFLHPDDMDDWQEDGCFECHTGVEP